MLDKNNELECYFVDELNKNKCNLIQNKEFTISHTVTNGSKQYSFSFKYYLTNVIQLYAKFTKTTETDVSSSLTQVLFDIEIKDIDNNETKFDFVLRLLKWGFYINNLKNIEFNLDDFKYSVLKVYANPPFTYPGRVELEIFLYGLPFVLCGPLIVYAFRCMFENPLGNITEQYRIVYCYAFSLKNVKGRHKDSSVPVIFFLPVRDNDYDYVTETISSNLSRTGKIIPIDFTNVDIDYNTLDTFLIDNISHLISYSPIDLHMIRGANDLCWGTDYVTRYDKMMDYYKNENFDDGLALLRKLVQDAEEIVCKRKNLQLPKKSDVQSLADVLRESNTIDIELEKWFDIITSYTNYASHKTFPKKEDLIGNPWLKDRLIITFLIGMNLIKELGSQNTDELSNRLLSH